MKRAVVGLAFALLAVPSAAALAASGARSVPSPMGGNGHNVTFDGRLFLVTTATGWQLRVFRPEMVAYDGDGFPGVGNAFSPEFHVNDGPSGENANALCEADADHTPYRCDAAGGADAAGGFDCY